MVEQFSLGELFDSIPNDGVEANPTSTQEPSTSEGGGNSYGVPGLEFIDSTTGNPFNGEEGASDDDDNNTTIDPSGEEGGEGSEITYKSEFTEGLVNTLKNSGIEFDPTDFDREDLTLEEAREKMQEELALDWIKKKNPTMFSAMESGVDANELARQQQRYQQILAAPNDLKIKQSLYDGILESRQRTGLLDVDEQGRVTQQSDASIKEEVEAMFAKLDDNKKGRIVKAHDARIQKALDAVPDALKTQQQKAMEQSISTYNEQKKAYLENMKKDLSKKDKFILPFGKGEKEEYVSFVEELMTFDDKVGKTNFMNKLDSEEGFFAKVSRLLYLANKGKLRLAVERKIRDEKNGLDLTQFNTTSTKSGKKGRVVAKKGGFTFYDSSK